MEQAEPFRDPHAASELERAPVLRPGLNLRGLSGGRVFVHHPRVASQILDARVGKVLLECKGQPMSEFLPLVRQLLEYDVTAEEWAAFQSQLAGFGFFEGTANRNPRVRLFDPGPAIDFLTRKCRWLFTPPAVVMLFVFLFAGLWRLFGNWSFFVEEVLRITREHPLLSVFLFYLCFLPVGLLHELAHGVVCRWFGGEVVEVGLRQDSANLYVLSNTAPLTTARARIFYFAGGALLDMFIFFLLVNVWLRWPNFLTLIFLLPQALFVLQFSVAMEGGSDLSRIISEWTRLKESGGRRGFLKEFFTALPKTPVERKRAAIYLASIAFQTAMAAWLVWSLRRPVPVMLWPGFELAVPFWPVLLYIFYRMLRWTFLNFRRFFPAADLRPAPSAG